MNIEELAFEKAKEIAARKEEILEAFVAKYGYQPDEMIICEQPCHNKYWVEYRPMRENYKKLIEFLKQEITMREYVCTTNHAVLLDNAKELLKEIGELDE